MENNPMDDLFMFTLCRDDWEMVIASLYESAGDKLSRADAVGRDSVYGSTLYSDGERTRAIAEYLEDFLPEDND
jgi:hypothetical protein